MPLDLTDTPPTFLADRPTTARDVKETVGGECSDIHRVPLASLKAADSPRLGGVNQEHVELLAQSDIEPILVHRDTLRVVDGMHRLQAARLQGEETIPVRYLKGPASEVFIRSVTANVSHGLPLTLADRKAAALRILGSHPDLSDRAIARITRLSPKTVSAVRRVSTEEAPQSKVRIGADGRSRPLDAERRREAARAFLAEHPDATLNEAAASAGISISTACEVRQRMRRKEGESAPRQSAAHEAQGRDPAGVHGKTAGSRRAGPGRPRRTTALAQDPSLRLTESGRALLRWLNKRAPDLEVGRQLVAAVPPHCTVVVADLANFYATEWQRFASALAQAVADTCEE